MTLVKKKIPQIFRFPLSTPLSHLKTLWDLQSECFAKTQALDIQIRMKYELFISSGTTRERPRPHSESVLLRDSGMGTQTQRERNNLSSTIRNMISNNN